MMHGQSRSTKFKEIRFAGILSQSLRISKALAVARWPYYHVDLNCGSGYNTELVVPIPGSPLNFLSAAERNHRTNYHAFFVDHDLTCIEALITRPDIEANAHRLTIHCGDNADILPAVAEFIAAHGDRACYAMGSVLIDPNGYHKGVPWETLRTFCAAHPRMDVVMNLNVRCFQLERAHIGRTWTGRTLHPIATFPVWFSRPHWMLTDICQLGGHRWVQLVGRTIGTAQAGYRSLGFYDLHSDRAQAILAELDECPPPRTAIELPLLSTL